MSRRDWTEAQARAWLKASLPRGWAVIAYRPVAVAGTAARARVGHSLFDGSSVDTTLRAACLALVRAAKRAGVAVATVEEPPDHNVTAAPEPQGGGR